MVKKRNKMIYASYLNKYKYFQCFCFTLLKKRHTIDQVTPIAFTFDFCQLLFICIFFFILFKQTTHSAAEFNYQISIKQELIYIKKKSELYSKN